MTTTDNTTTEMPMIEHPLWCDQHQDDARLAPAEDICGAHYGEGYRLDAGSTAAYRFDIGLYQQYEHHRGALLVHSPRIQLTVTDREIGHVPVTGYLSVKEAKRLRRLLALAIRDVEVAQWATTEHPV